MPGNLSPLSDKAVIVLTSPDGALARLAAADAGASGAQVKVLSGGTAAWVKAGHPMAKGFKDALDEPKDVWVRPYDLDQGNEAAMQTYLGWEVDLTKQIERDGTANFLDFGAAGERGSR
jgi:3-mercaptopyruvate sulfurtransferase SseA